MDYTGRQPQRGYSSSPGNGSVPTRAWPMPPEPILYSSNSECGSSSVGTGSLSASPTRALCQCADPKCLGGAACLGNTVKAAETPSYSAPGILRLDISSSTDSLPPQEWLPITSPSEEGQRKPWWQRFKQQVADEFYVVGLTVMSWLKPSEEGKHWVMFTPVLLISMLVIFFFMAAQYPYFYAYRNAHKCIIGSSQTCFLNAFPTPRLGPNFLLEWLQPGDTKATDFSFDFMNLWGARYAPAIASGQWQRWFTSQFVHLNVMHVMSNMSILVALGIPLERRFGWWRLILVWATAVLGGELLSAAVEDPCVQIIGASGGVFGLVGMLASDLLLNRQHLTLPLYRAVMALVFLGIFLGTVFLQPQVSHFSHLGGLLCGFLPTLMILPNKKVDRLQTVLPWVGLLSLVVWFSVLPAYVYQVVLKNAVCPP